MILQNGLIEIKLGEGKDFIAVEGIGHVGRQVLQAPCYELDGMIIGGEDWIYKSSETSRVLSNLCIESRFRYVCANHEDVLLFVTLRSFQGSPFIRFRYALCSDDPKSLTKSSGQDAIIYTGIETAEQVCMTEIQISQFDSIMHSFMPCFDRKSLTETEEGICFPGPITMMEADGWSSLLAYEHGAECPDSYLIFDAKKYEGNTSICVKARKGNYYHGQILSTDHSLESPWFHFALCAGGKEELFSHYRAFFLKHISECTESRKPYIFYNTWNNQERNKYYHNLPYLHSMNLEHTLAEIDTASKMGVDVFVIDAGWFSKTGDWAVSPDRFPDGLVEVRNKLDGYGMKLGLWFNPIVAAETSQIHREHPEFRMNKDGKDNYCGKIWETEESWGMCLASGYTDHFIRKLIDIHERLGVSYFKWDAIGQYGCNSPHHRHGTDANSPQERLECYSYQMGLEMIRIVEEVSRQCPGVIVDFDITEGSRFVGLGFLAVGKYFLMNNGPYFSSFDIPSDHRREPDTINVFFHPGAARARVCRQGTKYDSFLPSILFLTHFLPDGPARSQRNSLASLVLGGNGIWGDLSILTDEDILLFQRGLANYKKVANFATACNTHIKGFIGSSPEIHDKVDVENAKGFVCFFTRTAGTFEYLTRRINRGNHTCVEGADSFEWTAGNNLKLTVCLETNDARVVFIY